MVGVLLAEGIISEEALLLAAELLKGVGWSTMISGAERWRFDAAASSLCAALLLPFSPTNRRESRADDEEFLVVDGEALEDVIGSGRSFSNLLLLIGATVVVDCGGSGGFAEWVVEEP